MASANSSRQFSGNRTSSRVSIPSRGALHSKIAHADQGVKSVLAASVDISKPEEIRSHIAKLNKELEAYQALSRQVETRLTNPANQDERHCFKGRRLNHLNTMNAKINEFNDFLTAMGDEGLPLYNVNEQVSLASVMNASRNFDENFMVLDEYHARDSEEELDEGINSRLINRRNSLPNVEDRHLGDDRSRHPPGALASDLGNLTIEKDPSVRPKDSKAPPPMPRPRSRRPSLQGPSREESLPGKGKATSRTLGMEDSDDSDLLDTSVIVRPYKSRSLHTGATDVDRTNPRTGAGRDTTEHPMHHDGRRESEVPAREERGSSVHRDSVRPTREESEPHVHRDRRREPERPVREERRGRGRDLFSTPEIDTASFLARLELFKDPPYKFDGARDKYLNWSLSLNSKMNLAQLDGTERLQILQNHTCMKARIVVDTFANVLVSSEEHARLNFEEAWQALKERFGAEGQQVETIYNQVRDFAPIVDDKDWFEIGHLKDLCRTILVAMMSTGRVEAGLEHYNRKRGLLELALKLPKQLREDWHDYGYYYMMNTSGNPKPNLRTFINFLEDAYDRHRNDFFHGLYSGKGGKPESSDAKRPTGAGKGAARSVPFTSSYYSGEAAASESLECAFHEKCDHNTVDCPLFLQRDLKGRFDLMRKLQLCYICAQPHRRDACTVEVTCDTCKGRHFTALHRPYGNFKRTGESTSKGAAKKTEEKSDSKPDEDKDGKSSTFAGCTPSEGTNIDTCAFSLNFLIEVGHDTTEEVVECIAMLDCQAWTSFCVKELAEKLDLPAPHANYTLGTLSNLSTFMKGHQVSGLKVRNPNGGDWIYLPPLFTNEFIPEVRAKRATREIVSKIDHLSHLAPHFLDENASARTMLILGEDVQDLFWILSHGGKAPYAHETNLGWAVIGKVPRDDIPEGCMAKNAAMSKHVCHAHESFVAAPEFLPRHEQMSRASDVFEIREDDEEITWSADDEKFLDIMKQGLTITESGHIQLPLPLRSPETPLPSNEAAVYHRTRTALQRIKDCPNKLALVREAMQKNIDRGFVERVPEDSSTASECWWLPIFAVMHPRKPAARLVFDASATFRGTSLNNILHSGPDLNNSLQAVMLSFRLYPVAFSLDIEHMFHCFKIPPEQTNLLRFFWWQDNDPGKPIVQYRSSVHLFGACSSCAVATFALKAIAMIARQNGELSEDEATFIERCFYIDDGMGSKHTGDEVIALVARVRPILKKYGLNLHKVRSNEPAVVEALGGAQEQVDEENCDETLFAINQVPRALGVTWNDRSDELHVVLDLPARPFTRRGLLATTNTAFDPIGIAAPVILGARLQQRKILSQFPAKAKADWDEELPEEFGEEWKEWLSGVAGRSSISVKRCVFPLEPGARREVHVFADASMDAIAAVAYARSVNAKGEVVVRFLKGCSKLAPRAATTVPRLELCAALLAATMAYSILRNLKGVSIDKVCFYTDSSAVLGYLSNVTSNFARYITRRIEAIHRLTQNTHWKFVKTSENPADVATRPQTSNQLMESTWLSGPPFLQEEPIQEHACNEELKTLPETIPSVAALCAASKACLPSSHVEEWMGRVRSWSTAVRVMRLILSKAYAWLDRARQRLGVRLAVRPEADAMDAEARLFRLAQESAFPDLIDTGGANEAKLSKLPASHALKGLQPFLGAGGVLRVGGRLRNMVSPFEVKHPVILPKESNITTKFVKHQHVVSWHQGRVITLSAIRQKGAFVMSGKGVVSKIISHCVTCRRLRGPLMTQLMSDLPPPRVCESAPFEHIGLDVFGPYYVYDGKSTRRTVGTKKVFVLLVNCLASRAVHLEALEGMDTASLMNALRRFFSLRGSCKTLCSDHGSNFVGVLNEENFFNTFQKEMESRGMKWSLNPVGASHYGGCYERKIGAVRRVMEACLLVERTPVSRDELATLLQEAAAIVNSTPLYASPEEAQEPLAISPQMLLTLKAPDAFLPSSEDTTEADALAYGRRRWRKVQFLADEFWKSWRKNFLHELTRRSKWTRKHRNVQKGDVVIVREKNLPRCDWRVGVVRETKPGRDDLVRRVVVAVNDAKGRVRLSERAVADLVMLYSPKTASGGPGECDASAKTDASK